MAEIHQLTMDSSQLEPKPVWKLHVNTAAGITTIHAEHPFHGTRIVFAGPEADGDERLAFYVENERELDVDFWEAPV